MSIVERALEKSKESGERNRTPAADPRVGDARAGSARAQVADSAALRQSVATPPRLETPIFNIDLEPKMLFEAGLVTDRENAPRLRDEFRRLKWPLLEAAQPKAGHDPNLGRLIMVASAIAGEGKTFTTFNLAMALADERDTTVVLVDADIAKPRLSHSLGL